MNTEKFLSIYSETRNGCNDFYRHPLVPKFAFSDGVRDLADTGVWWLLDIAATEIPAVLKASGEHQGTFDVKVKDGRALLLFSVDDGHYIWKKRIDWTDMPDGKWQFLIANEGQGATPYRMILVKEY